MYEINLVPDVKAELIKAQKIRNLVFFVCFVVSAISVGLVIFLGVTRGAQEINIALKDNTLELMAGKLEEYDGLDELLTFKQQLNGLDQIRLNKKNSSRIFMVLASLLPTGDDTVSFYSLTADMDEGVLSLEGQANAGTSTDGIDYRVLEAFVKQAGMVNYDYGRYVDKNGLEIPTMCIDDVNEYGLPRTDENGNLYAIWTKGAKGCDPSRSDEEYVEDEDYLEEDYDQEDLDEEEIIEEESESEAEAENNSDAIETVTIRRTPEFSEWYRLGYMSDSGEISGVPHFESQCVNYTGISTGSGSKIVWNTENNCLLSPYGVTVENSSNGRESGGELVLKFEATVLVDPEVFNYNNKHMVMIAPTGRTNATDSYLQIDSMFVERALDCTKDDAECNKAGN